MSALLQMKDSLTPLFFSFLFLIPTQTAHLGFYGMECSANGVFMQVMAANE